MGPFPLARLTSLQETHCSALVTGKGESQGYLLFPQELTKRPREPVSGPTGPTAMSCPAQSWQKRRAGYPSSWLSLRCHSMPLTGPLLGKGSERTPAGLLLGALSPGDKVRGPSKATCSRPSHCGHHFLLTSQWPGPAVKWRPPHGNSWERSKDPSLPAHPLRVG